MANKPDSNPESISDLRHEVRGLNQNFKKLQESVDAATQTKPAWWKRLDHPVVAGIIVLAVGWAAARMTSLSTSEMNSYVDTRVQTQNAPMSERLTTIDERLSRMEGVLSVIRAEAAAAKYVKAPDKELKTHHEELRDIKDRLAQAKPNVPGYWPATFQIITLFSRATFDVEKVAAGPESSFSGK